MNKELTLKFKGLFEEQRRNLIYSGRVVNEDFNLNQDDLPDEADITSSELETSMRMRLRNREALFLKKIDEALRRISNGTFGECEQCGEDIDFRRLEARPTATLCVHCKEDQERREHVHIDGHKPKSLGTRVRLA
ncbi:MAG TPA: TraR/DksA family transcriptional regulator [Bdellovibrionota bacterium]|nr:TraR/DksA family transcriptional regulator [Bdellovibrionota bacterium]